MFIYHCLFSLFRFDDLRVKLYELVRNSSVDERAVVSVEEISVPLILDKVSLISYICKFVDISFFIDMVLHNGEEILHKCWV